MNSIAQIIEDHDEDFLDDFSANVHLDLENIEKYLMGATLDSEGHVDFSSMLAHVEQIKTNCRATFIDPLLGYVNVVEQALREVYYHQYQDIPELTELMLLMFDEVRAATEEIHMRHSLDTVLIDEFKEGIKSLLSTSADEMPKVCSNLLQRFAYRVHPDTVFSASEIQVEVVSPSHHYRTSDEHALEVFRDHAEASDNRSSFSVGRSKKIINAALAINRELPVEMRADSTQLIAAIYMHDVAMAYIPDAILFKEGKFSADEIMLLEQHPLQSSQLLSMMPNWQPAAEMVYQHHERFNGSGYPNGIQGNAICIGAKIIGVADTYYALTNKRPDRPFKKSSLRALLEINKHTGTLFDPYVVEALNIALQK